VASSNEVTVSTVRDYVNITNHPESQRYPTIDGNIITWEDGRTKNSLEPNMLRYYDISKGTVETVNIQIEGLRTSAQSPYVKGDYVIYSAQDASFNSTATNIYAVNLKTGSAFLVTKGPKDQLSPVVSDDGIAVWSDLRNGSNLDLWYLDLKTAQGEKPFIQAAGNQRSPRIWGNKVVWKDSRAGNRHDLYVKEIGGTEELLATNVGDGTPDIWENWVTWGYKDKLYLYNLNTKVTKVITDKNAGPVRMRDNKVVYSVIENNAYYIHIYDISTGVDTKLDCALLMTPTPTISNNIVVFDKLEPNTTSNAEIYMTRLE
jgi:beta propeller repeat protein